MNYTTIGIDVSKARGAASPSPGIHQTRTSLFVIQRRLGAVGIHRNMNSILSFRAPTQHPPTLKFHIDNPLKSFYTDLAKPRLFCRD